jgi:hypothetical protein
MYIKLRAGSQCDGVVVVVVSEHFGGCAVLELCRGGCIRLVEQGQMSEVARRCRWWIE